MSQKRDREHDVQDTTDLKKTCTETIELRQAIGRAVRGDSYKIFSIFEKKP